MAQFKYECPLIGDYMNNEIDLFTDKNFVHKSDR